jgi:dienelactone hydrolase
MESYDPFAAGPRAWELRSGWLDDPARGRLFPYDQWVPDGGGDHLVVYSHHSLGHRRAMAYLCEHLASHGYRVAAMDHSETAAVPVPRDETPAQRAERAADIVASRVPDLQLLLAGEPDAPIGAVGHSLGGWAVLTLPEVDRRVTAVVAYAPAGAPHERPGVLRAQLDFAWTHDVSVLYLTGDSDVPIPLPGVRGLAARTPGGATLAVLRDADHGHFLQDAEEQHEAIRATPMLPELSWLSAEMRPFAELAPAASAHAFTRALTLAHLDRVLRGRDVPLPDLAAHGIDAEYELPSP